METGDHRDNAVLHDMLPRLPSDFADVQDSTYDPQFISDISNKMQVPERISVQEAVGPVGDNWSNMPSMTVPDRIVVSGQDGHVGMRSSLRQFDFESQPAPDMTYVNLMTPPRVLTVQERNFPTVDDYAENPQMSQQQQVSRASHVNGDVAMYIPSADNSLLVNGDNEFAVLRTQMSKLVRRVTVIEQENDRRSQRELILYPMLIGYALLKVLSWFFRSR